MMNAQLEDALRGHSRLLLIKRTAHECWNVWRAKRGHDPYGMLLKNRPWPEVVRRTYVAHRDYLKQR